MGEADLKEKGTPLKKYLDTYKVKRVEELRMADATRDREREKDGEKKKTKGEEKRKAKTNPRLTPIPKPGTDITTVVGQDITEDGEDTTDGADTTDTPTDMDTVTWENALLMLNPKPKLPLKLMPLLMLTTDITDTHMLMDMAVTMVDT